MTAFTDKELSSYNGSPIELYKFEKGSQYWAYTSSDSDKTVDGIFYKAIPIKSSALTTSLELAKSNITITIPIDTDFAKLFLFYPPTEPINVFVSQYHESDSTKNIAIIWSGRVIPVTFSEHTAEVTCESIFTSMRRIILRRRYQLTCPHVLYGNGCKLVASAAAIAGTIASISGITLTISGLGTIVANSFAGGFIDYAQEGASNRRFITGHTDNVFNLDFPYINPIVGASVLVYPGCDHIFTTCIAKGNVENYGGQPFYGKSNPFLVSLF
jgi:uncharacterized phage protein (TIGR02218 family)